MVDDVLERNQSEAWGFTKEQLLDENLISWFLKDLRAAPLDFRGYVSGSSPSDDEDQAPWSDMNQIGQVGGDLVRLLVVLDSLTCLHSSLCRAIIQVTC